MHGWLAKLSELLDRLLTYDEEPVLGDTALSERDLLYRRKRAFAHECGHAVIAWLSPAVVRVEGIVFHADGSAATTIVTAQRHPNLHIEQALISLGGLAGETLVWKRVRSGGFGSDLPDAVEALTACLRQTTLRDLERRWSGLLEGTSIDVAAMFRERPPPEIAAGLDLCYRRAKRMLHENRAAFGRLVELAERQGNLSQEDIASRFGPRIWARR